MSISQRLQWYGLVPKVYRFKIIQELKPLDDSKFHNWKTTECQIVNEYFNKIVDNCEGTRNAHFSDIIFLCKIQNDTSIIKKGFL